MYVVCVHCHVKPEHREAFLEATLENGIRSKSRATCVSTSSSDSTIRIGSCSTRSTATKPAWPPIRNGPLCQVGRGRRVDGRAAAGLSIRVGFRRRRRVEGEWVGVEGEGRMTKGQMTKE